MLDFTQEGYNGGRLIDLPQETVHVFVLVWFKTAIMSMIGMLIIRVFTLTKRKTA